MYGRAGRLASHNGDFRPGQAAGHDVDACVVDRRPGAHPEPRAAAAAAAAGSGGWLVVTAEGNASFYENGQMAAVLRSRLPAEAVGTEGAARPRALVSVLG